MKLHQNEIDAINDALQGLDNAIGGNATGALAGMYSHDIARWKRLQYEKMINELERMLTNHNEAILDEEGCHA